MSQIPARDAQVEGAAPPLGTGEVVQRYQDMVYGIALTHTSCQGDADDVFQEVFLAYHRKQPECRSEEHRKAWLIRTALICARRMAADSWRTRVVPLSTEDLDAMPAVFQFATEQQDAIFRALCSLPLSYRTVLYLFYFADHPAAQIAQELELELGAVKMRLSRGRKLMREGLGELFDE
ncbi:MAG: sigma-70 family RNA polymerase sigma factor [Micrococcales bacterium]|nr:sigma-70 family RNA polymerase sigma factor [Micrococcales bacterium]